VGVLLAVVTARVDNRWVESEIAAGLNEPLAAEGRPLTLKLTGHPEKPPLGDKVTV
jgi:hypothetical protein